jgi:hypothetical protein
MILQREPPASAACGRVARCSGQGAQASWSSRRRRAGLSTCRPSGTARPFGSSHASFRPTTIVSGDVVAGEGPGPDPGGDEPLAGEPVIGDGHGGARHVQPPGQLPGREVGWSHAAGRATQRPGPGRSGQGDHRCQPVHDPGHRRRRRAPVGSTGLVRPPGLHRVPKEHHDDARARRCGWRWRDHGATPRKRRRLASNPWRSS